MKKRYIRFIFFLSIVVCLCGCKKEGPAGPQGEQGEQGERGAQGIPGADGSIVYSKKGAPSADIGKAGDYYLDKSNGKLYGPKTDAGWGSSLNLKGQKGATGAAGQDGKNGSQILSGKSAPKASIGNTGDYYWNSSSYTLYGPKKSSGWGAGIILRGLKGAKGDPGTANVLYSDWFQLEISNYLDAGYDFVPVPQITNEFIRQGGIVLVYATTNRPDDNDLTVFPLPHSYGYYDFNNDYGTDYMLDYDYSSSYGGQITFWEQPASLAEVWSDDPYPFTPYVCYMLIPGGRHLRKSSLAPNSQNYKATCAYYGIPQ